MSLLPSLNEVRSQINREARLKEKGQLDWSVVYKGLCPKCGERLREDARWLFCYRPSVHEIFRASKKQFGKQIDHSLPDKIITKKRKAKKRRPFKSNFSREQKREYAQMMNHMRSIQ